MKRLNFEINGGAEPTLSQRANGSSNAGGVSAEYLMNMYVTGNNPYVMTAGKTQVGCASAPLSNVNHRILCYWLPFAP